MRVLSETLFAAALLAATVIEASAQAPDPMLYSAENAPAAPSLQYPTGGYFYGDDCGGNALAVSTPLARGVPPGVILSGTAGAALAQILNCDDRRHALPSYRDAFEGTPGQAYRWHNPNGAVTGDVMTTSRFQITAAPATVLWRLPISVRACP